MAALGHLLVLLLLVLHSAAINDAARVRLGKGAIAVEVDTSDGSYEVTINNTTWLSSSDTFVTINGTRISAATGNLKLRATDLDSGVDIEGEYESETITWDANSNVFVTQFRVYQTHISFAQVFPFGLNATNVSNKDAVSTSFPSFTISSSTSENPSGRNSRRSSSSRTTSNIAGFLSYKGDMCGSAAQAEPWPGTVDHSNDQDDDDEGEIGVGIAGSGPLVLFTADGSTSTVLSALSNFMAQSQNVEGSSLQYGVMGRVQSFPAMYTVETVMVLSSGINKAMEDWGDVLLNRYGKQRTAYRDDFAMKYLGYSTDNGAYYYYNPIPGKTYEDTLIAVSQYAQSAGIPYRYVLLDSWWYYKGAGNGVSTWEPLPSVFPHGLEYLFNATGWPQQLHNRYWSSNNTYAKQNGGKWDFIIQGDRAVPTEQGFWDELLMDKRKTGMMMYEQDWLDAEFDDVLALQESATLARQWMLQMGNAAARVGATFQACMSHVRHILQSVESPAMTNARASGDYQPGNLQWYLGISSLLAWAVGIAPSKDNFWTTPDQSGSVYGPNAREPRNRLQSVVSTLTTGPIAIGDKINSSDVALILRSCAKDGTLLTPDRPATEIDAYFYYQATRKGLNGHVWSTYTILNGDNSHDQGIKTSFVFAVNVNELYQLSPVELGYPNNPNQQLIAFESNSTTSLILLNTGNSSSSSSSTLPIKPCGMYDFQLYTIVPVLAPSSWALLGEPNKWVSVSAARFSQVSVTAEGISVIIRGTPGEIITVNFADPALNVHTANCEIPATGRTRAFATAKMTFCDQ